MKGSRPEPQWDRGKKEGGVGESDKGVQGPPAVQVLAEAAVKRGPVFFPRPARRKTVLRAHQGQVPSLICTHIHTHTLTHTGRVCVKVVQISKLSVGLCDMGTPAFLPECFAVSSRPVNETTIRS